MNIKSPEDFHNKLGFVFHGLLALPLAAFVFLFLEIKHRNLQAVLTDGTVTIMTDIALTLVAVILTGVGYYRFRKGVKNTGKHLTLKNKLAIYFNISVKFYVLVGLSSLLLVLGLFLTTSTIFIIGYVLVLFLMSLNRPTLEKYAKDLPLTKEEKNILFQKKRFDASGPTSPEES